MPAAYQVFDFIKHQSITGVIQSIAGNRDPSQRGANPEITVSMHSAEIKEKSSMFFPKTEKGVPFLGLADRIADISALMAETAATNTESL